MADTHWVSSTAFLSMIGALLAFDTGANPAVVPAGYRPRGARQPVTEQPPAAIGLNASSAGTVEIGL